MPALREVIVAGGSGIPVFLTVFEAVSKNGNPASQSGLVPCNVIAGSADAAEKREFRIFSWIMRESRFYRRKRVKYGIPVFLRPSSWSDVLRAQRKSGNPVLLASPQRCAGAPLSEKAGIPFC